MRPLLLLAAALALHAQRPAFEVASIKPALPSGPHGISAGATGGPGTKDPGRWTARNMTLQDLILMAYRIQRFQLSGPSWLPGDRFDVDAKVPEGATREQLREMVQNLLAERFGLIARREHKPSAAYRLVAAKGGPKLAQAKPRDPDAPPPRLDGPLQVGRDGLPVPPPGVPIMLSTRGVVVRQAVGESMEALASMLGNQVGRPVTDATGLPGRYDFVLKWRATGRMMAAMPSHGGEGAVNPSGEELAPDLMTALEEQLGLKLESVKGEVEILVIERLEKAPTEN